MIALSTAAPLAAWIYTNGLCPDALIMLSPNFGPADSNAELLLLPWGNSIVKAAVGDYNEYEVVSDRHARYTTSHYRSEALLTMIAAEELGRRSDQEKLQIPVLFLYSLQDDVISLPQMEKTFDMIGSEYKMMREINSASGHVIAGDTHSPESTEELVQTFIDFIKRNVL